MQTLKNMVEYLDDNQLKIDEEIKNDDLALKIFNQIEELKNDLEDIIMLSEKKGK